ncbi:ImmA/IrrE family metallo-endopeptidase [Rhizobium laguerreae]|uniref:helix-turn-helix domain-containing protein n=1 Tax=Rhizobium laguerreae TaxID=1076926 RepID=UPI001C912394|nr:XRE family transcriptional regulator [Rhizobium laguerreae]MBY3101227.1 ImmA/IrrE family metallo-endopeptidase [Rhizobium laguerreae]
MIFSDRQYAVSKEQLNNLRTAALADQVGEGKLDWLKQIESNALQSQIADIQREMAEYDYLKSGAAGFTEEFSFEELPRVLIQARIARGLSQTDLAERLGLKAQQVQRYEATNYMSASLARLMEVARMLGVRVSASYGSGEERSEGAIYAWSDAGSIEWNKFPLREMARRGWIKGDDLATSARTWFHQVAGPQFATALHRKKMHSGNAPNEHALLAWQARVLQKATDDFNAGLIGEFTLNDRWLGQLVALTKDSDGPRKAKDLLSQNGIGMIVQNHLPGTYLDGAAMVAPFGNPVVALTLRFDRLDNFWFVLFHELGHVFLHLYNSLRFDFFDEEDGHQGDQYEEDADKFSLDQLIPQDVWRKCLSRFALTEEAVLIDAEKLGISASIIAGRIRKERNDFRLFTNLVGSGTVRMQFEGLME